MGSYHRMGAGGRGPDMAAVPVSLDALASGDCAKLGSGVCLMNPTWRDERHPSFIRFIASFLSANSYRLNFLPISPDFIFNNGGLSVAFIFETTWDPDKASVVFSRVERLKAQFRLLYVVIGVPTREQNDSFNHLYFKYGVELGRPTFVPVRDPEMGFEKIVKIAHARGVCKRQDAVGTMRSERERAVQGMDMFLRVVTSIPGIDDHDANASLFGLFSSCNLSALSKQYPKHPRALFWRQLTFRSRKPEESLGFSEIQRTISVQNSTKLQRTSS
ncbi:protein PARTING DANCERS homolog isoform X2 [Musa acuminata AAA Group]|uniref:protein PARTING DANCERS homolog isoform X2 n=1 Tax=Musa acuminata AAA Group TaxID=214697 RepID=UPI0031CE110A